MTSTRPGGGGSSHGTVEALDPPRGLRTPRVLVGGGALARVGEELDALGRTRALLVAGRDHPGSTIVREALGDREVARIADVAPHVPRRRASEAIAVFDESGADAVVTVGGGSATGLGKVLARDRDVALFAVPTTYAGSEMTPVWGETDGDRKTTGRDWRVLPAVVLADPGLLTTLDPGQIATSGLNALAHAVEALWAPDRTAAVRDASLDSARSLAGALPRCVADPTDREGQAVALRGALLAGACLANATMGIHHKACHVLGGMGGDHAATHAALLPHVLAWQEGYADAVTAPLVGVLAAEPAAGVFALSRALAAPTSLREVAGPGVERIEEVVAHVVEAAPASPRPVTESGVRELLESAYGLA
ncbi:maleylacetate reductase [Egibacter rhizosphaerae]|uniref:Maleylacetate reductase n=1 Tax=Egibacter rhizosphaerae TaxID=1670831 RepID=A0A411YIN7_9ACTN|nr:iron-containing alcohol dehydrogenase [Egibacter rhizosphaerae]QBI20989.1 maleylacetate reductase [Egibacter rhizosphaerae]